MGTPAIIAYKDGERIVWTSVKYDGYLDGVGRMLVEHYNDAERVKSLIALGSLSVLDKSIECPEGHSFDNRVKGYTVADGRDRGETGIESQSTESWLLFLHCNMGIIRYVFEDDVWYACRMMKNTGDFIDRFEMIRLDTLML